MNKLHKKFAIKILSLNNRLLPIVLDLILNPMEHVWANLKRLIRVHPNKEKNLQRAIDEPMGFYLLANYN